MTPKQEEFVRQFLIDLNATQAAIRAGYSVKTANEQGARLLANVSVQRAISGAMDRRAKRTEITAERVLQEFAKIAFFDPRGLFNEDGSPKSVTELDDDAAASVAGLDVVELYDDGEKLGQVKKIKLADKLGALTQIGRHLGMFNDKLQVTQDLSALSVEELVALDRIQAKLKAP